MSKPKTVKEYVVRGRFGGGWETMGYRETQLEARKYKEDLESQYSGMFTMFSIKPTMVAWEESEQYQKQLTRI